ncbi:ABC transporter ATP-binding protein [Spiroplasma sp. DGKH1]|uniref:ABC transporter ATP-binding protein n=1 Tax=Spiroplasma sp. DGKH1 TaxID=3050074 RepID=UPI0034C669FA
MDKEYAIEFNDISKKFKKFCALNNCNFKVAKNTIHGLIGPNGSGKTTCIKILLDILKPTTGQVYIDSFKNTDFQHLQQICYIPEKTNFYRNIKALPFLIQFGILCGYSKQESKIQAQKLMEQMNLTAFGAKDPNKFSSGMKKKYMIAIGLMNNPQIIILDEPTANLDPTARKEIYEIINQLKLRGKTILICSHILSELENIIDDITILAYSEVKYTGHFIKEQSNNWIITFNKNDALEIISDTLTILQNNHLEIIDKISDYKYLVKFNHNFQTAKTVISYLLKLNINFEEIIKEQISLENLYEQYVFSNEHQTVN